MNTVLHRNTSLAERTPALCAKPNGLLYFIGILHWLNELQHSVPNPMVAVLHRNTSLAERAPALRAKPNGYCTVLHRNTPLAERAPTLRAKPNGCCAVLHAQVLLCGSPTSKPAAILVSCTREESLLGRRQRLLSHLRQPSLPFSTGRKGSPTRQGSLPSLLLQRTLSAMRMRRFFLNLWDCMGVAPPRPCTHSREGARSAP